MIVGKSPPWAVLPGPPGKSVSPENRIGQSFQEEADRAHRVARRVDGVEAQLADLDDVAVGDHPVVGRQHRGVLAADADFEAGVAGGGDRPDVVEMAVGGEHPADPGGLGDGDDQVVLAGGVEEDGLARSLVPQDEHVVLPRADHELVEADAGILEVGRSLRD